MSNFNFVVLGSENEIYKYAFKDISNLENVIYVPGNFPKKNTLKGLLYRIHFNKRINSLFKLPFKSIWNNFYFKDTLAKNNSYCFIFLTSFSNYAKQSDFHTFLREKYPNCKLVLFLTDLFSVQRELYSCVNWSVAKEKSIYDLILSYDNEECDKYGFVYHHTVFSQNISLPNLDVSKSDVYFVGKYKGRLDLLISTYDKLSSMGLCCDFYVYKCPEEKKVLRNGIHYIDYPLSYAENLVRTKNTKCVLELMQNNAVGYTYRTWESISFGKLMITNNSYVLNAPFYEQDKILVVSSAEDIEKSFTTKIMTDKIVTYKYADKLSPIAFLNFIEEYFNKI